MSSSIQRRRSIEPGVAFAWAQPDKSAPSPSSPSRDCTERRVCSHHQPAADSGHHPTLQDERPAQGSLSSLNLKSDYVVPPMSSVSVDPPIPAETDSRSAQDQHPMRTNLPLLSQPLLSAEAFHAAPAHQRLQISAATGHATCIGDYAGGSTTGLTAVVADDSGGPTLLTLPPEIRRMIYQHIPYITNRQPLIYCLSIFKNRKQHPLAAICRLVRSEALELYYSSNTWMVKLEYRDFYDSFVSWISSLDDASANALRLLRVSVRGSMFAKPMIYGPDGSLVENTDKGAYGYATFAVDLSEKFKFGKVEVLACDGPKAAGLKGKKALEDLTKDLWEKKGRGQLRSSDLKKAMDTFLSFTGWWL